MSESEPPYAEAAYARRAVWIIAGLAVALRLALLGWSGVALENDASGYWDLASSLLANGTLSQGGVPTASRLPGYPLLVAALRLIVDAPWFIAVAQSLLDGSNCLLIARIARELLPKVARGPMLAAAAWALYPYAMRYSVRVLTETPSITILLLTIIASFDPTRTRRSAGLIGLGLGALTYFKPSFMLLLPCLAVYAALRLPRDERAPLMRRLALAALVFVIVFSPWPLRNQFIFGRPISGATNFGQSFFNGMYGGGTLGSPWDLDAAEYGPQGASEDERRVRLAMLAPMAHMGEIERNDALTALTWSVVKQDPVHSLRNVALSFPRLWLRFPWEQPPTARGLALTAVQAAWLMPCVLAWWRTRRRTGAGLRSPNHSLVMVWIEAVAIYTTGVHCFTTPVTRYSAPAYALACALLAALLLKGQREVEHPK